MRGNEAGLLANLRSDSEPAGRLFIKMACDWQTLSLLKRANTGASPQTEHAIHFPAVVSFVQQSLLHAHYVVRTRDRWPCVADVHS